MTKILLVEDDKSLREIYGVRLLAEGYDIISAGDGEEALAMAIKDRPSLIVSDVMMPKISGFDMLDILRSTTETKDIKVIMMTALSSEDQRKRGEQLGADRYLVKSQVGIEDVVRTVHDVLGDAPISLSTSSPFSSTPTPSAQPATPPTQPPAASPAPAERPAMVAAPAPRPVFHGTPSNPSPAPQTSTLPQPTAPFSTPRPNPGSGRIIEPVSMPTSSDQASIASRLDDELRSSNQAAPAPSAPQSAPVAPNVGPVPSVTPPSTPAPAPQQAPAAQSPQPQQTPPLPPTQPTPGQPS